MKVKTVKRYWCDFCGKASLSAGHMRKHEAHCTLNPDRACRVCKMVDSDTTPKVATLVSILPDHEKFKRSANGDVWYYDDALGAACDAEMEKLREAAHGCPACMLAAIRQAHIPVPLTNFDYKAGMQAVWARINEEQYIKDCEANRYG